jgi:outer membrane lipoprotein SlyB
MVRLSLLALAGLTTLGCVAAPSQSFAQSTTIDYGRITAVRQVELQNQGAQSAGALIGGLAGVASGSGQSGSNRALRGLGGAAVGRAVGGAAGSSTGFEYTILIGGTRTIRIVTEKAGLRMGDCVSVERGAFNNVRLAQDERCDVTPAVVPNDEAAAANACIAAKDQVLNATTDEEFDRAERRMRLFCD